MYTTQRNHEFIAHTHGLVLIRQDKSEETSGKYQDFDKEREAEGRGFKPMTTEGWHQKHSNVVQQINHTLLNPAEGTAPGWKQKPLLFL